MNQETTFIAANHSRSLVSQIGLLVVAGLALTGIFTSGIYIMVADTRLHDEIDRRHRVLSDQLAVVIESAWRQNNYPLMVQVVDSLLSDGDVHRARIIDNTGTAIVSSDLHETGLLFDSKDSGDLTVNIADIGQLHLFIENTSQSTFIWGLLWRDS